MKILRIAHRLYPPKVGGLSYYAHLISAEQARVGHRVVAFTTLEGGYPEHEFRDGYEIFRFRALAWPWDNPITVSMMGPLLASRDFDVANAHSHLMFTTSLAGLKRALSDIPLIITNHGFRVARGTILDLAQDLYLRSIGRQVLQAADFVISFTHSERNRTVTAGVPAAKAVVIPNGVDTALFRPVSCEPIPQSIVWTGRFVAEKGVHYLLEAARLVTSEFPDSKFMLAGYGDELPDLLSLRRQLGLEDRVFFLGPMSQAQIATLLNRCTALALPSLTEGFPSSVLEAMACEKPVVVTSGIGLEEIVGDAGVYVPRANPRALADEIKRILRNADMGLELGRRGRQRVVDYYDWRNIVSQVNELFELAAARKVRD
jgi:glycosyltransferase involved in cell wall biosynthesis